MLSTSRGNRVMVRAMAKRWADHGSTWARLTRGGAWGRRCGGAGGRGWRRERGGGIWRSRRWTASPAAEERRGIGGAAVGEDLGSVGLGRGGGGRQPGHL